MNDQMALQRLKDEAEKAKIALSTSESIDINIPFITADATGPKHLANVLSRPKFEALIADLNDRLVAPCKNCVRDADTKIDKVVLVGGTTRIPSVQAKIHDIFGIEPSKGVNADEVVACGAAIQGGVLKGEVKDVLLLDVTPLTLSICTNGSVATPMIPRNTTIPTKKTETFSNAASMQPQATILIGQGERKMFADNKLLGQFNVELTPMPQPGQNQIQITYDIDANGILHVSAKDIALDKEANITITASSGLSKEEIEKAKADAEAHAAEDERKLELANAKSSAESLCNNLEKSMNDAGSKLTDDDKKSVNDAIAKLREGMKSDDINQIKSANDALMKVWEPIVAKLYPQGHANSQQQFTQEQMDQMMKDPKFADIFKNATSYGCGETPTPKKDDEPIDADIVVG